MLSISKLSGVCETLFKRPLLVNYVKDFAKLSVSISSQDFSASSGAVTRSKKLEDAKKEKQMSSAIRMYLKRKRELDIFISKERAEFDLNHDIWRQTPGTRQRTRFSTSSESGQVGRHSEDDL